MDRQIFACKGASTYGQPVVAGVSKLKMPPIRLVMVGTDTAKDLIYSRLELTGEGEGQCHFPLTDDRRYFEMLTAEEKVIEWKAGSPVIKWKLGEAEDSDGKKKRKKRNEALDCRVYALAALRLLPVNLKALARRAAKKVESRKLEKAEALPEPEDAEASVEEEKPKVKRKRVQRQRRRRGGGWSVGAV